MVHGTPGVLVNSVEPTDNCAHAGLIAGSALIAVGGKPVSSHAQALKLLEAEASDRDAATECFEVVVRDPIDAKPRAARNLAVAR